MKKKSEKSKLRVKKPKKSDQMLVRQGHLDLVRKELKSSITSLRLEMKAGFKAIDARFTGIDARFETLENKMTQMLILMEEQKEKNKFVLDGYMKSFKNLLIEKNH
ncbi:hypothetical protein K2X05_12440 [bacterium]|nr:hypothetical protein [bacterium]